MMQSTSTNATSSYIYDHLNQRVKLVEGASTTIFASREYSVTGSSTVKHIFANGVLIATIDTGTTYYTLTDHLGGTNLVTDTSGNGKETIDYYPYGAIRFDNKATGFNEKRKYIGEHYDEERGTKKGLTGF